MTLRDELGVPGKFPDDVLEEAEAAARRPLPDVLDLREIAFRTLDPSGARDLDQAYAIERRANGWTVRYAIADVAHFVDPGSAIDREARRRGVTYYLPDGRAPLHPPVLSEGAASLLPGEDRPAVVWTMTVGTDGSEGDTRVERAIVRSREQLVYETVHDELLREVGEALEDAEARRGGVSLDLPSQEVVADGDRWVLRIDDVLPTEGWNEQLSLLAGRTAARLMLDGGVGILRTMPPPEPEPVGELRHVAEALGVDWEPGDSYADVVRAVDRTSECGAVFLRHAARLLRGAGYVAFDGDAPSLVTHAAVAAPYAHVTAPLRRLADRHANEIVLAQCAGRPVPEWVRRELPALPGIMSAANRKAAEVERAAIDLAEAMLLWPRVGAVLEAMVVSVGSRTATVAVREPVVVAASVVGADWEPGDRVQVRVAGVDLDARRVDLFPA